MSERAKPRSLKYMLHKHLSDMADARPLSNLHASELTKEDGVCPRMYALADVTEIEMPPQDVSASNQMTWEMGRNTQDAIVNWFADMGMAVVDWQCRSCDTMHPFQKRPSECSHCGRSTFDPKEPRFVSAVTGASAGIDMFIDWGDGEPYEVVELKTMDKDEFKTLAMPLAEHRLRTNLYLRIIDESDDIRATRVNTDQGWVFYTSKGGYGVADPDIRAWGLSEYFSPWKEYHALRDDAQTKDMAVRAKAINDFRAGRTTMPMGLCTTALDDRAKKCPCRKPCFSGEHTAHNDWKKRGLR